MKRYKSVTELFKKVDKSKKEYHNRKLSFKEKLDILCLLQEKYCYFNKSAKYKFSESLNIEKAVGALNDLKNNDLIKDYVIGGATALLHYVKPTFYTEDIDVFISFSQHSFLIDLSKIYDFLKSKYNAKEEKEYLVINGVPLQFLVPGSKLTEEAFDKAKPIDLNGKKVKIFGFEYLIAIMIELGSPKYKNRLKDIVEKKEYDEEKLISILKKYNLMEKYKKYLV